MATPGNASSPFTPTPEDPYGVPTGVVPRVRAPMPQPYAPAYRDPIQQAVDDYLLMERKARAWDALLRTRADPVLIAEMNAMVHPAQPSAPAER